MHVPKYVSEALGGKDHDQIVSVCVAEIDDHLSRKNKQLSIVAHRTKGSRLSHTCRGMYG